MPPYLAGRTAEQDDIKRLLQQRVILENVVITGLRGVGKTVLLETVKPAAQSMRWLWVSQDLSESASVTEAALAERVIADLAMLTASFLVSTERQQAFGFVGHDTHFSRPIGYNDLRKVYDETPGLISDKLKSVLLAVWKVIPRGAISGIVFAYDEAQNLADHRAKDQFPLSMLLDVFQSIQRMQIPYLLMLTGLPTLFPKLVEARTYTERMFHVIFLSQLDKAASREAIVVPVKKAGRPIYFSDETTNAIVEMSGGYPYFIQFICREVFDAWISQLDKGKEPRVPVLEITRKLDNDFFHGRWAKATDRERHLLRVISTLPNCDSEFTVQEVTMASNEILKKPFSNSRISQMLAALSDAGLVYKNRHGKYSFAVPLFASFILRQSLEGLARI